MTFRSILLKLHLYVALAIGLFLIVIGLTGASLVFEEKLDRALNPAVSYVEPQGSRLDIQDLLERVRSAEPSGRVTAVRLAAAPNQPLQFFHQKGFTIYVNPYSGEILGRRTVQDREHGLARRLHVLHVSLFAGEWGKKVVGLACVLALFLVVSGLILWWPRKIVTFKWKASWKRVNFDLHHVLGLTASLFSLVITLAGSIIAYPGIFDPWINRLDGSPPLIRPERSTLIPGKSPITLGEAVSIAEAALPGAILNNISIPQGGPAIVRAQMKFPEDRTPAGRSRVYIDQYSGKVLLVESTRTSPPGTRIQNLKRSLHTGDILGAPTQAIYFLASLILVSQVVTGVLMWWNSRRRTPEVTAEPME
jgi:uncharacterized iron-regulated membrane protein